MIELNDEILLSLMIVSVVVATMCLIYLLTCRRRKRKQNNHHTVSTTIYTVPTNYNSVEPRVLTPHRNTLRNNRISSCGNDRFAVPLDLLPPNFDYSAPGVEHKGDHVIIKDLRLIEMPTSAEYQKQSPYNPNFI